MTIDNGKKSFYQKYNNILLEAELYIRRNINANIYVKLSGIKEDYSPNIKKLKLLLLILV